jgi:hypothetical protein
MVNRNSPTGSRTHQERRASARRANETHLQWREFFPERVRSRTTGGLRPPLLAACADVIADTRFAPTSTLILPRGAYAPRSWLHDATLTAKSDIVDAHTHTHEERRASARRGVTYRRCAVRIEDYSATSEASIKSGGRQPAVGTKRICNGASFSRSEYVRAPRGAYAPRSWWFCSTDIRRRNCGLCDARTLVSEERRASGRRGVIA